MPRGSGANRITLEITGNAQNAVKAIRTMAAHTARLAKGLGVVGQQSAKGYQQAGRQFTNFANRTVRESSRMRKALLGVLAISDRFGRRFARAGLVGGVGGASIFAGRELLSRTQKFNRELDRGAGFAGEMRNNVATLGAAMRAFGEGVQGAGEGVADVLDLLVKSSNQSKEAQRAISALNINIDQLRRLPPSKAFDVFLGQLCLLYTSPSPRDS